MNEDHLDAFVRESEENIVDLNNSLLELEDDPTNREAIDLIFRTAHTLKGNFSAMGFERAGALAHAIEDLLDEIRAGRVDVTPEVMDLIFAGVDDLESILGEIEREGDVATDPGPTIDALRDVIESEAESAGGGGSTAEAGDDQESTATEALESLLGGVDVGAIEGRACRVRVELAESDMKGVDAMLVLEAVEGELELLGTSPGRDDIEDGAFEAGFDLLVEAREPSEVERFFRDVSTVGDVTVDDVTETIHGANGTDDPDRPTEVASSDEVASTPDDIKSVRVDVGQLDDLYSLVEQLVTSRIKLRRSIEEDPASAADSLDELDKITTSLQNTVMDMRLIPLRKVVNTFPRLVRDLARSQEKEVRFEMTGTDIELDRTILDEISDPLMHVLRNAVDHGIEPPDERESAGKPREGTITLEASRERDHVDIVVEDDGAGLDPDAIREKALQGDILPDAEIEAMDEEAIYDLVFHPGFSTSEEITDVSGRGVGMDVVRSTVSRLDGSVSVSSEPGDGTTVTLRLPVTMAIVRVLFVEVDGREFGLPIKAIDEITPVEELRTVNGREMIEHGDAIYPVIDLRERLADAAGARNGDGKLLRIRESERRVALRCDGVSRQEEVVIKPFEGELGDVPGMSGTAVVGDGQVVPIIDVATL